MYAVLEAHGALDLLRDDLITMATKEIQAEGRSRREIQKDIKSKERAIEALASRYERKNLDQEHIRQVSIPRCHYLYPPDFDFLEARLLYV